jgi:hypothetical protein
MAIFKKFHTTVLFLLISLLILAVFVILMQKRQISHLKRSLVTVTIGERIEYFDMIGTDNQQVDASVLNNGKISMIVIFKQRCASCNRNVTLWKRMATILKDEVNIYGIWLGDHSEILDFQERAKLGFNLYSPLDEERLKEELRLNLNLAQTIVYMDNKVSMVRIGSLEGTDYTTILKRIKYKLKKEKI